MPLLLALKVCTIAPLAGHAQLMTLASAARGEGLTSTGAGAGRPRLRLGAGEGRGWRAAARPAGHLQDLADRDLVGVAEVVPTLDAFDVHIVGTGDLVERVARLDHIAAARLSRRCGLPAGHVDHRCTSPFRCAAGQNGQAERPRDKERAAQARHGRAHSHIGQLQLPVEHTFLLFAQDCIPARSGTKRTASNSVRFQLAAPVRSSRTWRWFEPPAGAMRRPPGASCVSSACGMARPAAATTIASNGATPGRPKVPSP
ncbi:hypothetical protein G6F31_015743 [Rhizopus arrhizus]|nr:hypothetical protein G6F31_015743 [Rhizopus arrhizus]